MGCCGGKIRPRTTRTKRLPVERKDIRPLIPLNKCPHCGSAVIRTNNGKRICTVCKKLRRI